MPINETFDSIGGAFDVPSEKDFIAVHTLGADAVELPDRVNLNNVPCHDQKRSMHCTAYSLTHIVEIMNTIEWKMKALADAEEMWANQQYQAGPVRAASMDKDGDSLQNALTSLAINGLNNKNTQLPLDKFRITNYARIEKTVDSIKSWLAKGFPIYTGSGNHCYPIVGYENANKVFICKNSYGDKFGVRGDGTFTVDFADIDRFFSMYIIYDKQDMNMLYRDVSDKSPMYEAIKWALEQKLMVGYGTAEKAVDRFFMPDKAITRAEMAQILFNMKK